MRLSALQLQNYRGHADLRVEFPALFNVIVGVNGSGKTSLAEDSPGSLMRGLRC